MKKLFAILLLVVAITACNGIEDARKVHIGMSTDELIEAMGEPRYTELNAGYDEWHYRYYDGAIENHMVIKVVNDEVTYFYTW